MYIVNEDLLSIGRMNNSTSILMIAIDTCIQQTCISPEPGAKANWQWGRVGWMLADHRDGLSSSSCWAWSSTAQSVCQWAFSLLEILFQKPSGFESCIQQRTTTCLLSIRKLLACARASKLTTTNIYVYNMDMHNQHTKCGIHIDKHDPFGSFYEYQWWSWRMQWKGFRHQLPFEKTLVTCGLLTQRAASIMELGCFIWR